MDSLNRSRDLYQTGQLEAALVAMQEACAQSPSNAEAWWLLGCVTRHLGLIGLSDDGFRRAAELLPKQMPLPHRVSPEHFRTLLDEAKRILAESRSTTSAMGQKMTAQELRALGEAATGILQASTAARRWGIMVPGQAPAAQLETAIVSLPRRDAIRGGLSPDAQWSRKEQPVVLYQSNHENTAGSDRDLVHLLVRNLVFANTNAPGMATGSA
ncbi:MAG: tetratricopeptide repeat protein [Chloroflexi bacterium]|nr:MAG: tetratricopeptide repeat protein [Chloroflexota bacterium]